MGSPSVTPSSGCRRRGSVSARRTRTPSRGTWTVAVRSVAARGSRSTACLGTHTGSGCRTPTIPISQSTTRIPQAARTCTTRTFLRPPLKRRMSEASQQCAFFSELRSVLQEFVAQSIRFPAADDTSVDAALADENTASPKKDEEHNKHNEFAHYIFDRFTEHQRRASGAVVSLVCAWGVRDLA